MGMMELPEMDQEFVMMVQRCLSSRSFPSFPGCVAKIHNGPAASLVSKYRSDDQSADFASHQASRFSICDDI